MNNEKITIDQAQLWYQRILSQPWEYTINRHPLRVVSHYEDKAFKILIITHLHKTLPTISSISVVTPDGDLHAKIDYCNEIEAGAIAIKLCLSWLQDFIKNNS